MASEHCCILPTDKFTGSVVYESWFPKHKHIVCPADTRLSFFLSSSWDLQMKIIFLSAMCDHSSAIKVLCFLLLIHKAHEASAITKYLRSNEICSANNGKRIYLELGDKGVLKATNITTPILTNNVSRFCRIFFL